MTDPSCEASKYRPGDTAKRHAGVRARRLWRRQSLQKSVFVRNLLQLLDLRCDEGGVLEDIVRKYEEMRDTIISRFGGDGNWFG
jgi:hypothetical protein